MHLKYLKWAVIALVIGYAIYLIMPKYYFLKTETQLLRCNEVTGACEVRLQGGSWRL